MAGETCRITVLMCHDREDPPTLADNSSSTSALLPVHEEEDEETVSDLAFPHLKHSSVIPQWITKRKPPSVKHKIGTSNSEILDDQGRPAWLNDKQKDFFVQVCNVVTIMWLLFDWNS